MEAQLCTQETQADTPSADVAAILLVEDEPTVRMVVQKILQTDKYQIDTTDDGSRAKEMLTRRGYDLLLTDINLPGASGMELLQFAKERAPSMEVILMTGYPVLIDAVKSVKGGAFDYISKPIMSDKLRTQVKAALRHRTEPPPPTRSETATTVGLALPGKSYRVVRSLGTGNNGIVLLVEKEGHPYAMKILKTVGEQAATDKQMQRFIREGEIISKLNLDGVVKVHELGFGPSHPAPYILMEYVDGPSLSTLVSDGNLPMPTRLDLLTQVVQTLATVHDQGIIHRDIKPSNVLIESGNKAKICDFGTARLGVSHLTMTCEMLGSPAYMAPETFMGNSHAVDHRTDIFSCGVLAYELFTGDLPFLGETLSELIQSICNRNPAAPTKLNRAVSPALEDILARMLEKEPEHRYQSAHEIVADLKTCEHGRARSRFRTCLHRLFDRRAWT